METTIALDDAPILETSLVTLDDEHLRIADQLFDRIEANWIAEVFMLTNAELQLVGSLLNQVRERKVS